MSKLQASISSSPLIAILRGLSPKNAEGIGKALYQSGFRMIEVPLNREYALESIEILAHHLPEDCIVGAGTVLTTDDVDAVKAVGGQLIVSPNANPNVISRTRELSMISLPGIATPTEAFNAIDAGAHGLKVFPASSYGFDHLKALTTVLPENTPLIAVGGVTLNNYPQWLSAGAQAVGIGSDLFKADDSLSDIKQRLSAHF